MKRLPIRANPFRLSAPLMAACIMDATIRLRSKTKAKNEVTYIKETEETNP